MKIQRYGWSRDIPDHRDLTIGSATGTQLPSSIDMRPQFPTCYDQGQLGSCTGNACAGAIEYIREMQGLPNFTPSRLMLYYGAREIEGTIGFDSGAQIRDVIKSAAQWGAAPEAAWPYDERQFTTKPSDAAYAAGTKDRAIGYYRVNQTLDDFRQVLANGDPIVFGFTVYESFESDSVAMSGICPMPGANEHVVGGHAVVMVGYDDARQCFIVRNSWSWTWGLKGYFDFPYAYAANPNLAADFWAIKLVTP